jgi:lysophospholipase L1-like esterase
MIIFIYGDSITQGLWDKNGGWADRIKDYVINDGIVKNLKDYSEIYNLGIGGNTTTQILNRFDSETKDRLWPDEQYAFIFATGLNDTLHRNNQDFVSTPEKYLAEISEIHKKAQKYSGKILFVGLTPVDEPKTNPVLNSSSGK